MASILDRLTKLVESIEPQQEVLFINTLAGDIIPEDQPNALHIILEINDENVDTL